MTKQIPGTVVFEMLIEEAFQFSDGRIVFTGQVTDAPSYIPACDCELLVDDRRVATLRIEGERILTNKQRRDVRAVSTVETVEIAQIRRSQGRCKLRAVPPG
jgi:hypothetical protein